MAQQQSQSHFSRVQKQGSPADTAEAAQDASLSPPAAPDATSPYQGPADETPKGRTPERVADPHGPEEMEQPYFSEAQSTLAAFAPAQRVGDPSPQPEDPRAENPQPGALDAPAEQPQPASSQTGGGSFATAHGTIRAGMEVVDGYGHVLGAVSGVEGERLQLASTDSHSDGSSFVPLSLVEAIEGDRVILGGRGDASFGMPTE